MVAQPCSSCGATRVPEARFCRLCGALLEATSAGETGQSPIAPLARTGPLKTEGRSTRGLPAADPRRSSPDTSRVGRTEMEELLRHARREEQASRYEANNLEAQSEATTSSAPQTSALVPPTPTEAPAVSVTPAAGGARQVNLARPRRVWQGAVVALLCVALGLGLLAFVLSRRSASSDASDAPPVSVSDQKKPVEAQLSEAESLLASGNVSGAILRLRDAIKSNPTNAEMRVRLGEALERSGARHEAMDEYRAATQIAPHNSAAWRALASAQFTEGLYSEAAESYRALMSATSESNLKDAERLEYADALRLAERLEEARAAYQRISSSASDEGARRKAAQHLKELSPSQQIVSNSEMGRGARDNFAQNSSPEMLAPPEPPPAIVSASPSSPSSPSLPAPPPPQPTPPIANRASTAHTGGADSYYLQALNIITGRDIKKLQRAELLQALELFQRAAATAGGTHREQAKRYADQLGKEFDRRKKW